MQTGIDVAKDFNREVLKGQLNPNGSTVAELGRRIDAALTTNRWFWKGFNQDEAMDYRDKKIAALQAELAELKKAK